MTCAWDIEGDKGQTQRQHPKTQNREEAKYTPGDEKQADEGSDSRRHVIAPPL